ncbi:hypothetical protein DAI22_07g117400 [Oryza sativa Japonica Group]|jgi:hypothetical protein|nr:hypothetical protein DAI22_07g117400 [Oryza sativa Japonica Group]
MLFHDFLVKYLYEKNEGQSPERIETNLKFDTSLSQVNEISLPCTEPDSNTGNCDPLLTSSGVAFNN